MAVEFQKGCQNVFSLSFCKDEYFVSLIYLKKKTLHNVMIIKSTSVHEDH